MRCKQGDLAIVVRSHCGNLGKIVRCLELVVDERWQLYDTNVWRVDSPVKVVSLLGESELSYTVPDCCLHPLRGEEDDLVESTNKELETV